MSQSDSPLATAPVNPTLPAATPPQEIERKFIADPSAATEPAKAVWHIEQGYLDDNISIHVVPRDEDDEDSVERAYLTVVRSTEVDSGAQMITKVPVAFARDVQQFANPATTKTGARIRLRTDAATGETEAFLTIKGEAKGAARMELETLIDAVFSREALDCAVKMKLEKTRHLIEFEGQDWELDVFKGALAGLVLAELELKSEDQAITIPSWVGQEVTEDGRYSNAALAKRVKKKEGISDLGFFEKVHEKTVGGIRKIGF